MALALSDNLSLYNSSTGIQFGVHTPKVLREKRCLLTRPNPSNLSHSGAHSQSHSHSIMITRAMTKRNKAARRDTIFSVPYVSIITSYLSFDNVKMFSQAFPLFKSELFTFRLQLLESALIKEGLNWSNLKEMREFEKRIKRYFTYGKMDASDVAQRIRYFISTRNKPDLRRKHLIEKLQEMSLTLRRDSLLCQVFISAAEDIDIEEVAAIMMLTKEQFSTHYLVWSRNHIRVEKILRDAAYKDGFDWEKATKLAISEIDTDFVYRRRYRSHYHDPWESDCESWGSDCESWDSFDDESRWGYD